VITEASPNQLLSAAPPARKRRWNRLALRALAALFLCLLLLLWYMGQFDGNVRAVVPGRVYRSAQLTGGSFQAMTARWAGNSLDSVLGSDRIRTVINLRGGSKADDWYRAERAICARRGITYIDVPFSAVRMPPPAQLDRLLAAFDSAAYPILFHCRGGADRSGLAGVLYLHLYQNVPLDEAEARQLTWRYGHLSWGQARAMDRFFDLYRQTNRGLDLRQWIETAYPTLYARLPAAEKAPAPDVAPASPEPVAPQLRAGRAVLQAR